MTNLIFAAEEAAASDSPLAALGVDARSLIFQLLTFVLVFLVLQRFAFKPISRLLAERRKTIDEGVRAGQELAKERAKETQDQLAKAESAFDKLAKAEMEKTNQQGLDLMKKAVENKSYK